MSNKESKEGPSWLSADYDEKHREETAPLFGTGEIPDEETPKSGRQEEKQEEGEEGSHTQGYGSVVPSDEETGDDTVTKRTSNKSKMKKKVEISDKPHMPGQNPCLWLFHFLSGVTIIASVCLLATQILPLCLVRPKYYPQKIGILSLALKVYISILCAIFIIVELGLPVPFVRTSALLQTYATRGFIYSFIGLICVEEAYSERVKDLVSHSQETFHVGWAAIFMQLSSWLMLTTGIVYMFLGACCMKRLRDKLKADEIEAWREYRKALKEWKDRKE